MTTGPTSRSVPVSRRLRAAAYDFAPVVPALGAGLLLQNDRFLGAWTDGVGQTLAFLLNLWAGRRILLRDRDGASAGKRRERLRVEGEFPIARNFTLALAPLSAAAVQGLSLLLFLHIWRGGEGGALSFLVGGIQVFLLILGVFGGSLLLLVEAILVAAGRERIGDRLSGTSVRVDEGGPRR